VLLDFEVVPRLTSKTPLVFRLAPAAEPTASRPGTPGSIRSAAAAER
jgi:hypothetical protein